MSRSRSWPPPPPCWPPPSWPPPGWSPCPTFGLRCVSIIPFFILVTKFTDWSSRFATRPLLILKSSWKGRLDWKILPSNLRARTC
ncbi:MAG: hypothetical protein DME60_14350 [Verrucomicrobia bacterium]|nr:MAG: hypothetical protein DME60_14350 [Verrucomicrobiota bacterium]